jgi:hypothetical protein
MGPQRIVAQASVCKLRRLFHFAWFVPKRNLFGATSE